MAKKKDKLQVINNIGEVNLEIDYDKLAKAIVKAQEQVDTIEPYMEDKSEYVSKTILGKVKKNYFSFSLAKLISALFYLMGIGVPIFTIKFFPVVKVYIYNNLFSSQNSPMWIFYILYGYSIIAILAISVFFFSIFFNIAEEIKHEKNRNFVVAVFSGTVSFAALIVALVALFKGVG